MNAMTTTVAHLVSRLTLEQKAAQLSAFAVTDLIDRTAAEQRAEISIDIDRLAALRPHGTGHLSLAWFLGHDTEACAAAWTRCRPRYARPRRSASGPVVDGQVPGVDPVNFTFTDLFQTRMPGLDPAFETVTRGLHAQAPTALTALRRFDPDIVHAPLGRFERRPDAPLTAADVAATVAGADLVIAVVGERTGWVGNNTAGEGQTTADPRLTGDQEQLLTLLADTGRPVVTVVVSGRPLVLTSVAEASRAVLLAPLLGEAAGDAIAAAVFGAVNPSGKLPTTFPRHVGQVPIYHGHHYGSGYDHPTGTRHGYNDLADDQPLYAFGHGLSYSSFLVRYDHTAGPAVEATGRGIRARFAVTNVGDVDGETVVQLYARDEAASIVRPVRQLLDFARVAVPAGRTVHLAFDAPLERLFYTMIDGRRGIESGDVTIMGALASDDVHCATTVQVGAVWA
jgi:beta-xylosidase